MLIRVVEHKNTLTWRLGSKAADIKHTTFPNDLKNEVSQMKSVLTFDLLAIAVCSGDLSSVLRMPAHMEPHCNCEDQRS